MRVTLLGTGAADGIPQPFCACATCTYARSSGVSRQPGGVLIDDCLLIDAAPGLSGAVARAGVSLDGVHTIAVTHAHPDHWDPSVLLYRRWVDDARPGELPPLQVIGPSAVLASASSWLPPDATVVLTEAHAGDVHRLAGGLELTVLPSTHGRSEGAVDAIADEAVLYAVRDTADGAAVLYAADTGEPDDAMLAALTDGRFTMALLELTFGRTGPRTPGHLDHAGFAATVASLRRVGALTDDTDVVAIHVGHHNPPEPDLADFLATHAARLVPDGTSVEVGQRTGRTTLVTGGARSGKSAFAERLAAASHRQVTYVATGPPASDDDADWSARIEAHQARRPAGWTTVETADLPQTLRGATPGSFVLVDCLTLWLTRILDGTWDDHTAASITAERAAGDLCGSLRAARAAGVDVVLVTNEVGSGIVPATASGRMFADLLGRLNATVAAHCDEVVLTVAGRPVRLEAT